MTSPFAARRQAPWILAAVASLAVLANVPPTATSFYPRCPIYQFTGLLCPGCGSTRALYALLHGQLHQAIQLNALFVLIVLPAVFLYVLVSVKRGHWLRLNSPAIATALIITSVFTILRNLP